MSIQPSSAMDSAADLVDGVKQKKDFPLKFCTVCASNQNRFVPLPSLPLLRRYFFSLSCVMFTSDGAKALVGFYVLVSLLCRLVEIFFFPFFFSISCDAG